MLPLSVIIITRNEEHNIAACLDSVSFAAERIVLDDGSTDRTREIAAANGAKVHSSGPWSGFGEQKNRALQLASSDWILSLDADERATPELGAEIGAAIELNETDCFAVPRRSWFCGKFMSHGGWYPDYVTRLFRKGSARFSDDLVHEKLLTQGRVIKLKNPLLHYTYRDLTDVLEKMQRYSTYGAGVLTAEGKNCGFATAIFRGVWAFLRTYFLRLGFLDGKWGLALAVYNAETVYYKHLKAMTHPTQRKR